MKKISFATLFIFMFMFAITFNAMAIEPTTIKSTTEPTTEALNARNIKEKVKTKILDTRNAKKDVKKEKVVDLNCVKTAVEKRETAIIAAIDTYSTSVKASFEARKTALLVAWGITDTKARNIAIKNAFAKNKVAKRVATKIYKKARLITWQQFTKARIACNAEPTGEDMSVDANFND